MEPVLWPESTYDRVMRARIHINELFYESLEKVGISLGQDATTSVTEVASEEEPPAVECAMKALQQRVLRVIQSLADSTVLTLPDAEMRRHSMDDSYRCTAPGADKTSVSILPEDGESALGVAAVLEQRALSYRHPCSSTEASAHIRTSRSSVCRLCAGGRTM